jgi:hypothetical protein
MVWIFDETTWITLAILVVSIIRILILDIERNAKKQRGTNLNEVPRIGGR